MHTFIEDLRYGARMLLKRPMLTLVAVITLALGIGANLTIFSFVDTMFLRPLPVREPYQLVTADGGFAYPAYTHFRDHNKSFEALAAHYSTAPLDVGAYGDSQTVNGAVVSANYFSTLGINPSLGRFFSPDASDEEPAVWSERYRSDHFRVDCRGAAVCRRTGVLDSGAPGDQSRSTGGATLRVKTLAIAEVSTWSGSDRVATLGVLGLRATRSLPLPVLTS